MKLFGAARSLGERTATVLVSAAALAALVWVLPAFYRCPIRTLFHISCPGCGMTRAAMLLMHLDFGGAFAAHPMVYGLLGYGAVFVYAYLAGRMRLIHSRYYWGSFCALMLLIWVLRLLTGTLPAA